MDRDTAAIIERNHDVYVDHISEQYNRDGRDVMYGWEAIPREWIDDAKDT